MRFYLILLLLSLANINWAQTDIDSLEKALSSSQGKVRVKTLNQLAKSYWRKDTQKTLAYGRQALSLSREINDHSGEGQALVNIGMGYQYFSAIDIALEYYLDALRIFSNSADRKNHAEVLSHISDVYWSTENLTRSLEYDSEALKIYRSLQDPDGISNVVNSMGLSLTQLKRFSEAMDHFNESVRIEERRNNQQRIARACNNIGILYSDQGKYRKALPYYQKALRIHRAHGDRWGQAEVMNNLCVVYTHLKSHGSARRMLDSAIPHIRAVESDALLQDNYLYASDLYAAMGNHRESLRYHKAYVELKETLVSADEKHRVADLQTFYATEIKEKRIRLLESETALRDARIRSQKIWLVFSVGMLIVATSAGILITLQYLNKKRALKTLVQKNLAIVEYEKKMLTLYEASQSVMAKKKKPIVASLKDRLKSSPSDGKSDDLDTLHSEKYTGSPLTEGQKVHIQEQVLKAVEQEKCFLEHNLTMNGLSERLGINRTYISQVINEKFHKSFTTLINEYRIKEARRLLYEDMKRLYTIESIAMSVGFHSTNAFNKAFKRYTGITPSFFIKSIRNASNNSSQDDTTDD